MKNLSVKLLLLFFLFVPFTARAQNSSGGNITTNGTDCTTANACITLKVPESAGTVAFTVSGTYSGTLQFEVSQDGTQTNKIAVNCYPPNSTTAATSTTSTGTWTCVVAGMNIFQIRASAFASGTAVINIKSSIATAANSLSGGGGTVSSVVIAGTTNQINVAGTCTITSTGTCTLSLPNGVILGTDNSAAGTLQLANGSANAHTIFASGATTSNTIAGFATVPTTAHVVTCTVSSTTCTLTDGGGVSGTGSFCMTTNCSMTTPALGTPSALVLTNATGTVTNLTLVTPALGTPSALVLTNATGLPAAQVPAVLVTNGTSRTLANGAETVICTSTCTVTPPGTLTAGQQFCVQNDDNVSTVITLAAVTAILYEATARTSYGTANHTMTSGGAVKDQICMEAKDATHFNVWSSVGTWTNN